MIESILCFSVRILSFGLRLIPLSSALCFGRMLGNLTYFLNIKRRRTVLNNLKIAFGATKTIDEINIINRQFFQHFGQNVVEVLRLPLFKERNFSNLLTLEGKEHIDQARQKEKGAILLAMHLGSWEMASIASGMLGCPYRVLVKRQKKFPKLMQLLNQYRQCAGSLVLMKDNGIKTMVQALKNNEVIGMVADQGGRQGRLISFMGHTSSMSDGAIRLGLKYQAAICPCVIFRQPQGRHKIVIYPPLNLETTGDSDRDIDLNLKKIVSLMENVILDHPSEYMWFYKVWKYSDERRIVILSDGKTGHLRQSQAVASLLKNLLEEQKKQVTIETVPVELIQKNGSFLYSLFPQILSRRFSRMKKFVSSETYNKLAVIKPDYVISCGSSVAWINHLLSKNTLSRSIAIQRPGMLALKEFDLVVLPQHDVIGEKKQKGIVITHGAANLITSNYLKEQSDLLIKRFTHLKTFPSLRIGLILGGDTKHYRLTEELVKVVTHQVREAADALKADILLTTSRRTSLKVDNFLMRELKKYPRLSLLVLPNRDNIPEALGGIVGLSDILIVSGDSISMVSEAATSGKNTIVFPVVKKRRALFRTFKHDLFVEKLNEQGFILSSDPQSLSKTILNVAKHKNRTRRMDDHPVILQALHQIV